MRAGRVWASHMRRRAPGEDARSAGNSREAILRAAAYAVSYSPFEASAVMR